MAPHRLAIAAIFRNENAYLGEWLAYHRLVGVDHFYLYDNDGAAAAAALLAPWEAAGFVTRHPWWHYNGTRYDRPTPWGGRNKNHLAFAHAAARYRTEVSWLMKMDIDEFLVPDDGDLPAVLGGYDAGAVRGLRIPRFNFGDCGHVEQPPGLVIESYLKREAEPSNYKALASGSTLSRNRLCNSAHDWHHRLWPRPPLLRGAGVRGLRLFHYYTKSLVEYMTRQNTSGGRGMTVEHFRSRNRLCHAVTDDRMLRHVPGVRTLLATMAPATPAAAGARPAGGRVPAPR